MARFFISGRFEMQKFKTALMDEAALVRAVRRISHEIVERNKGTENLVLVGIKSRGIPLAKMIRENILALEGVELPLETLDTSLYRDDIARRNSARPSFDRCYGQAYYPR